MIRSFTLCAALVAVAAPSAAQIESRTVRVHYRTAELATSDGRAGLERRLLRAADQVCAYPLTGTMLKQIDRTCRTGALDSAREQLAAKTGDAVRIAAAR